MDKNVIQNYVNEFRRYISKYLKPNIGIEIDIYNCGEEGAVLIVSFNPGGISIDKEFDGYQKISEVLGSISQNLIRGNMSGIHFGGTNMMMEPNRILVIKENAEQEWSISKLKEDLDKIIQPPAKSKVS
jgi:hypothetical protein